MRDQRPPQQLTQTPRHRLANLVLLIECCTVYPFKWSPHSAYLCFYCGRPFKEPLALREHTITHKPEKVKNVLRRVKREVLIKVDVTAPKCRLCDDAEGDLNELKTHLQSRHGKTFHAQPNDGYLPFVLNAPYECQLCLAPYASFHRLNQHMYTHFSNYICARCGAAFQSGEKLRKHERSHAAGSVRCRVCGELFAAPAQMSAHAARCHGNRARHPCPRCDERFKDYWSRRRHLIAVHGETHLLVACAHCDKKYAKRDDLFKHVMKNHEGIKDPCL